MLPLLFWSCGSPPPAKTQNTLRGRFSASLLSRSVVKRLFIEQAAQKELVRGHTPFLNYRQV